MWGIPTQHLMELSKEDLVTTDAHTIKAVSLTYCLLNTELDDLNNVGHKPWVLARCHKVAKLDKANKRRQTCAACTTCHLL